MSESLGGITAELTPEQLAAIEAAVPVDQVAGTRYDAHGMASLDSER